MIRSYYFLHNEPQINPPTYTIGKADMIQIFLFFITSWENCNIILTYVPEFKIVVSTVVISTYYYDLRALIRLNGIRITFHYGYEIFWVLSLKAFHP